MRTLGFPDGVEVAKANVEVKWRPWNLHALLRRSRKWVQGEIKEVSAVVFMSLVSVNEYDMCLVWIAKEYFTRLSIFANDHLI